MYGFFEENLHFDPVVLVLLFWSNRRIINSLVIKIRFHRKTIQLENPKFDSSETRRLKKVKL